MPKWVRLLDALENPKKYEDISQTPIDYSPDFDTSPRIGRIITRDDKNKSVYEDVKVVPRYYATKFSGVVYLVSNEVSIEELDICGEKTAIEEIQGDAKKYGNTRLKAKGVDWNEERIGILDTLPTFLRKIAGWYWTTIPCATFDKEGNFNPGLKLIYNGVVKGEESFAVLRRGIYPNFASAFVRPLIQLPPDILVDLQDINESPLKIKRGLHMM